MGSILLDRMLHAETSGIWLAMFSLALGLIRFWQSMVSYIDRAAAGAKATKEGNG